MSDWDPSPLEPDEAFFAVLLIGLGVTQFLIIIMLIISWLNNG